MTAATPGPHTSATTRRAGAAWFTFFTLAWLAIWTAQLTPLQLLIPLQLNTPGDADRWISGVVSSGLVLAAGGLAGVIAGPLAGGMSDRTRGAFGRRRPWALGGVLLGSGSLLTLAFATDAWGVAVSWIGVSVGVAVASAAFTAMIADQLTDQRGTASAAISSSQALGIVVGVGVIVLLGLGVITGYLVLGSILLVAGGLGALVLPDPPAPAASDTARTRLSAAERFAVFRDRDFAWMLWGRLVVNIGNALGTGLLLFFLLYGLHRDPTGAQDELLLLIVVYTVFVVVASIVAGAVSDRTGRRRGLTAAAALVQGGAAVLLAAFPSFELALVAAALLGVGYGAYMAVGLALGTDLLPFQEDSARDLGFVTVAASLGQLLGPLVGAGLVAAVGGFWLLFLGSAVLSVVGGLMTLMVRAEPRHPSSPAPRRSRR
ncbi:MFS transporter [Microbacterium hominis]|uniref:MFS transporter permease n=1 Tax=Microbacterium hominis TaxID=162426 RepID=A0A0B4DSK3_9MICO|nr:MFS transporter [Microbacterium hominis]KIC57228.1 MFS transporter permease [Microbacterium hominis]